MTAARISAAAAVAAVIAWGIKGAVIGIAGGLDKSALESPLFILGFIAIVVAFAAFGVAFAARRPVWLRALAGVAAVVVGVAAILLIESVVDALLPNSTGWVEEEVGLWVSALLTAALILSWLRRWHGVRSRTLA